LTEAEIVKLPNAPLIRRHYDAFRARDRERLMALIAEDAVRHMPGSTPTSGRRRV